MPNDLRMWKCPECDSGVELSYDEFANIGIPLCDCEGGPWDMELQPEE
ncbi:hypothetical protein KAR91_42440 [Candidatus Pacearchaeota archaeon]|nr:hypothetical protein [Candidatus Pacearchaeota archaeon]